VSFLSFLLRHLTSPPPLLEEKRLIVPLLTAQIPRRAIRHLLPLRRQSDRVRLRRGAGGAPERIPQVADAARGGDAGAEDIKAGHGGEARRQERAAGERDEGQGLSHLRRQGHGRGGGEVTNELIFQPCVNALGVYCTDSVECWDCRFIDDRFILLVPDVIPAVPVLYFPSFRKERRWRHIESGYISRNARYISYTLLCNPASRKIFKHPHQFPALPITVPAPGVTQSK